MTGKSVSYNEFCSHYEMATRIKKQSSKKVLVLRKIYDFIDEIKSYSKKLKSKIKNYG